MLRQLPPLLCVFLACVALAPVASGLQAGTSSTPATQSAASSSQALKEKIVFVRADPSLGVAAMRTITVANDTTGRTSELGLSTSTHDAPDMQATASANVRTSMNTGDFETWKGGRGTISMHTTISRQRKVGIGGRAI